MNLTPVLPIVVVVFFWAVVFVACFVSFTRMLRQPTEPELDAEHEHTAVEEATEAPVH